MLAAQALSEIGFELLTTRDRYQRRIHCYLASPPGAEQLPLALYIQGSGYHPLFWMRDGKPTGQHQSLLAKVAAGRVSVLCVEKPGVDTQAALPVDGSATHAPAEFLREHTLPRWSEALRAGLAEARSRQADSAKKLLLVGHSEGAVVAAHLARLCPEVSHLALLSGSGPSQLFDFLQQAASDSEHLAQLQHSYRMLSESEHDNDELLWGHPIARWRSFLQVSTIDEVLAGNASVFCAHGSEDRKVPFSSALVLVAELMRKQHPLLFYPVYGADHGFNTVDGPKMAMVFQRMLAWLYDADKQDNKLC